MSPLLAIRDAVDNGEPNPEGRILSIISAVFGALAATFVISRWIIRIKIHKLIGADDWVILAALFNAAGMMYLSIGEAALGFGLHKEVVDLEHTHQGMKLFLAYQVLFKAATTLTKVSILLLFLRIFPSTWFRVASWATMVAVVLFGFSVIVASIVQCTPIEKAYNPQLPGHCIQVGDIWYSTASFAIITDLIIIALPINQIPSLKLPKSQKIGLALIFSIGLFVIAIEIVRICMLGPVTTSKDYTYYQASATLWAGLEVNVGIICACTPMLRTPLTRLLNVLFPRSPTNTTARRSTVPSWPASLATENKIRFSEHKSRFSESQPRYSYSGSKIRVGVAQPSMVYSYPTRREGTESDEEIMLESRGIVKTTNFRVEYGDVSPPESAEGAGKDEGALAPHAM
ncbi:hypothetical protein MMC30_004041 [Trapelia coarctata]|nr:hypothetical protein [Trapelia coarctata]